jgi:hypothetical protein
MVFEKKSILRLLAFIVIAGFCFLCTEAQTNIHVSVVTGADGPSCGTTGFPCASLQGALTVLGSSSGSISIAAGTYTGASNTNLSIVLSQVSIVGIGKVVFSGRRSSRGWTLEGTNIVIENIAFSEFSTTGLFGRISGDNSTKLTDGLRIWRSDCDRQWYSDLFELYLHQQLCHERVQL